MKREGANMKRKILLTCLFLLLILSGCQKEPISEYRLPDMSIWFLGRDSYTPITDFDFQKERDSFTLDSEYGSNTILEDNCLILEANDTQKKALIKNNLALAKKAIPNIKSISKKNEVEWSEDCSSVTFTLDYNTCLTNDHQKAIETYYHFTWINSILRTNRILLTGDCDTILKVTVRNADSGHIVSTSLLPYEPMEVNSIDWAKSETEDVTVQHKYEEYVPIKMSLKEYDGEKMIFTPEKSDSLYTKDDSLCLCLDSVYAENVVLPYNIKKGDEFVLRVDGLYAIHEDGDNIPDIQPKSMIPARYVKEDK